MQIRKVPIPHRILAEIPPNERRFFLLAGHILNECTVCNKLMVWCLGFKNPKKSKHESQASSLQALMIGKIYAAKIREAYNIISTQYYGTRLSAEYQERLSKSGIFSLKEFNRYFNSKDNPIHLARNFAASHYSPEYSEKNWEQASIESGF